MAERPVTDGGLVRVARQFRKGLLGRKSSRGTCGMVSMALGGYLAFLGIKTEYVETDLQDAPTEAANHAWLRLPDGRVLDATADQFDELGLPPVYLGPPIAPIHGPSPRGPSRE